MHFIKLILVAIVCELLACLGLSSEQDKSISVKQEITNETPVTVIIDNPSDKKDPSEPEKVYIMKM